VRVAVQDRRAGRSGGGRRISGDIRDSFETLWEYENFQNAAAAERGFLGQAV